MAQYTGSENNPVDPSSCDREPIHICGLIQTHGMLLAVDDGDLTIAHVSANCEQWLQEAPGQLIGHPLDALLTTGSLAMLRECLAEGTETTSSLRTLEFALGNGEPSAFYASAHRSNNVVIIELERLPIFNGVEDDCALILLGKCRIANHRLSQCKSVNELCQVITQELYSLANYDRVMVYQFDEEWNGAVIAQGDCAKLGNVRPSRQAGV